MAVDGQRGGRPRPRVRAGGVEQVELSLMGTFALRVDEQLVDLPGGAQRLLALLALQGRTARSRLAGTLWPATSEPRALARLRTGIWRVNQLAPQLITVAGDTVDVDGRARIDTREFVERASAALRSTSVDVSGWPVRSHHHELLADWDDGWLTHERERLHQLRLHLLERLAAQMISDGLFGLAVDTALLALRCDSLRESAHRALIRAHLAEGNVGEARRAYQQCARLLRTELGISPTAATTALLETPPR